ncbi:MAG: hypothetical protein GXY92_02635 [Syntrophomonadaceae bacterium]|nr:hypothetical protein [Syntrophomonadaceae bacterium]
MGNSLVSQLGFNPQNIDTNDYLLTLLDEALRAGLISESTLQELQIQIMEILKDQIIRYTRGKSSSIPVEAAQNLLQSILFCMDTFCLGFPTPITCLSELLERGMKEVYREGLALVKSKVNEAKKLFAEVRSTRIQTSLIAYNSTLNEAIPDFFKNYDANFNAHDTAAGIDYPLAGDDVNARGVEYIQQYLQKMKMENMFCRRFSRKEIDRLLENYGRVYRIRYPEFLINIFEIVLTNAIFSVMLGEKATSLTLRKNQVVLLRERLSGLEVSEMGSLLRSTIDRVIEELGIRDQDMIVYIFRCGENLLPRLINAVQQETLQRLAIPVMDDPEPEILFEFGESMNDEDFRRLVEDLLACADPAEKARMIMSRIRSLVDFIDILKADCLFGDEYRVLFERLGDMELSILARVILVDELRDQSDEFSFAKALSLIQISDTVWVNQLSVFLQQLSHDRQQAIEDLLKTETGMVI